jgi:hypothetical protein
VNKNDINVNKNDINVNNVPCENTKIYKNANVKRVNVHVFDVFEEFVFFLML